MVCVVITGGRDHRVSQEEHQMLARLVEKLDVDLIFVGDCPTGVDAWVRTWCAGEEVGCDVFKAEWGLYGKGAGPRRNIDMVEQADAVIAFPGGRGTASCIREAQKRKVPVWDIRTGDLMAH